MDNILIWADTLLKTFSWLLPATVLFTFLLCGFSLHMSSGIRLRTALILQSGLSLTVIGWIYLTQYLISIGIL